MSKLTGFLSTVFRRPSWRVGTGLRGRVHRISIVAGGEVSIVVRFGLDEPRARQLLQGALIEVFETRDGIPAPDAGAPGAIVMLPPEQKGELQVCTCGAPGGYPHEPECDWWLPRDEAARKAREGRT